MPQAPSLPFASDGAAGRAGADRAAAGSAAAGSRSADSGPEPAVIAVEGLGKTYRVADKQPGLAGTVRHFLRRRTRDVQAVRDVSFSIQPGEMVGFLGANSAGNTTTLMMLCGLIQPTAGRVMQNASAIRTGRDVLT